MMKFDWTQNSFGMLSEARRTEECDASLENDATTWIGDKSHYAAFSWHLNNERFLAQL